MTTAGVAHGHGTAASTPAFWSMAPDDVRTLVATGTAARERVSRRPKNTGAARLLSWLRVIGRQFVSPITLILIVAALTAMVTGDTVDGSIILGIVVCSALLGAWQEGHAADAVAELLTQVAVLVHVRRRGQALDVRTDDVEPGDELTLATGDVVPGDCLLLTATGLTVDESALTGEAFPVAKQSGVVLDAATPLAQRTNSLFAGTHVVSGTGTALVVLTGSRTTFGHVTASLNRKPTPTSFEVGVRRFGLLLLRVMLILVAVIMLINLLLHRPLADSLLFALALAVGITPQMLPVVVTVSLAAGARRLARSKVVVKRLDVIEDLGAMSVLCSDKTGTITAGVVGVDSAVDASGADSARVLELATLNSGLQTGYPNPLDGAILARSPLPASAQSLGEIPYDFQRKRLSVATALAGETTLITKGSFASVLACCTHAEAASGAVAVDSIAAGLTERVHTLGQAGFRVIAVATRPLVGQVGALTPDDERDLSFAGLLVFHDPVKPDVKASVDALAALHVAVKVISGDSRDVTGSLAAALGVRAEVVTGAQIEAADTARLHELVTGHDLFAEVEPMHKVAILAALKKAGETVGFLGDGINDAAALHVADVGMSVDSAVNVAKEAAAIVLLEKDLGVIADGVRLGRHTFANTLKYVRVAASANFGNILSMVIAAAVLPFLPMLPAQILLLNFMSDIPNTFVSRDRVDPERLERAGTWDMRGVVRFMLAFGALSTVFDLATFAVLMRFFHSGEVLFHTGWFVESALTQFTAMMTLRTARPAWTSRPDRMFFVVSAGVAVLTVAVVFSPVAPLLGFVALPLPLLGILVAVVLVYGLGNEALKRVMGFGDRGHPRRPERRGSVPSADPSPDPVPSMGPAPDPVPAR
ncbi:MAG TPA: magnesium-translocating P-type ATPase [Cellulomonas sp.]